jgi:hypothetical protein
LSTPIQNQEQHQKQIELQAAVLQSEILHIDNLNASTAEKQFYLELASFGMHARYLDKGSVICQLLVPDTKEANAALSKVLKTTNGFYGQRERVSSPSQEHCYSCLLLTAAERTEIEALFKGTELSLWTFRDIATAIEDGVSGVAPLVNPTDNERKNSNARRWNEVGIALAELSRTGLSWDQQYDLAFRLSSAMQDLRYIGEDLLKQVKMDFAQHLLARTEAAKSSGTDAAVSEISPEEERQCFDEARRLVRAYALESGHLKQVQDAIMPLARALLKLPSPTLKSVAYSEIDHNYNLLGRALELYGPDQQPMLQCLDDWKAFLDERVASLGRNFEETINRAAKVTSADRGADTKRQPEPHLQFFFGNGYTGLMLGQDSRDGVPNALPQDTLWGMRLMGVPGPIGDRAFAITSDTFDRANAEALPYRQACFKSLVGEPIHSNEDVPEEMRETRELTNDMMRNYHRGNAERLVHHISIDILESLYWCLPGLFGKDTPLKVDLALHLDRSLNLLEKSIESATVSPGLRDTVRRAARRLASEMGDSDYLEVLDTNPTLAERAKKIFAVCKVRGSELNGEHLRARGILPAVESGPLVEQG